MDFYGHRVGETPFYQEDSLTDRIAGISRRGVPNVYVKDEADNPSGGHKARVVARAIERCAKDSGYEVILARVTDGGFAETFGYLAGFAPKNVSFASVVDYSMPRPDVKRLSRYGPVVKADLKAGRLGSSQIAELVRKKTGQKDAVIVPIDNIDADGDGYESIARELYDSRVRGSYGIFMPIGGGNTMVGIVRGFEKLGEVPRMSGATIPGNVFSDVPENGHGAGTTLHAKFSGVEREMRRIIAKYNIPVYTIYDEEREEARKFLQGAGIRVGRTSPVAWAAIERHAREIGFGDGENIIYLNTGYDVPPKELMQSSRWTRYAAGVLLMPLLLSMSSDSNYRSNMLHRISEETRQYMLEFDKSETLTEPEKDVIEAFARLEGKDGKMNEEVFRILHMFVLHNDLPARDAYNTIPDFRAVVDRYNSFKRLRESITRRSAEDIEYIKSRVQEGLRQQFGQQDTPFEASWIQDYLERDPYLNDKIAFALFKTRGKKDKEFYRIVSDLHWPGYGNIEGALCRDDPQCLSTRRAFEEWKKRQQENWNNNVPVELR